MQFINKSVVIVFSLFFFISCSKGEKKIPQGILKEEKMVELLVDIHLAQAAVNLSNFGQSNLPNDFEKLKKDIYSKHQISKEKFLESFTYYTNHPEKFDKIYGDVITELSRQQAEYTK